MSKKKRSVTHLRGRKLKKSVIVCESLNELTRDLIIQPNRYISVIKVVLFAICYHYYHYILLSTMSSNIDQNSTKPSAEIPDGYVVVTGPDDQQYVVPQFMVPALHQMFDGYRKKQDLDAFRHAGNVSCYFFIYNEDAGKAGLVYVGFPATLPGPTYTGAGISYRSILSGL